MIRTVTTEMREREAGRSKVPKPTNVNVIVKRLRMISEDITKDAFGHHAAAISTIADILADSLDNRIWRPENMRPLI